MEPRSIAVLPFANASGNPDQDYFADGMVEGLIDALSRFKDLFVIARPSSFAFRGRAADIRQVGHDLGVAYVLEGSVARTGRRVSLTAQLTDALTGARLWTDRHDGDLADVFIVQSRLAETVAGILYPALGQAEIERVRRKPPASPDAYDLALRAAPMVFASSATEAGRAVTLLDEALRLSPDYALAHALIAMAYGQIFRSAGGIGHAEERAKAAAHARRVVEVADDDSTALAHTGFLLLLTQQDVVGARAALDRAVALNPNSALAYTYRAFVLGMSGEPELGIEDATLALRLNPLDPVGYQPLMALAVAHIVLHRYDEAVGLAEKAIDLAPPRYPMTHAWLTVAECARGNPAGAERHVRRLTEILPGFVPGQLARLFDVFPPPLRASAIATLAAAGLVPATEIPFPKRL